MKTSSYITGDNTVAVLAGNINVLASGTDLTGPPGECMLSWQHWTMIMCAAVLYVYQGQEMMLATQLVHPSGNVGPFMTSDGHYFELKILFL